MLRIDTLLKIKDDIDLEKLKEFKFSSTPYEEHYRFMNEDEYLWVNKYSRKIDMTSPEYFCKCMKSKYIINKLKKANMVEKAVEDE